MKSGGNETAIYSQYLKAASRQEYGRKRFIDGVVLDETRFFTAEDGLFAEVARLNETGGLEDKNLPMLQVAQVNFSRTNPGVVKAWHFHRKQNEIWFIPPLDGPIIVGLMDIRESSPTLGRTMRLALGGGKSYRLYIPSGVAHGLTNRSPGEARLIYLVDNQFDANDPDEWRLDSQTGVESDFWEIRKG